MTDRLPPCTCTDRDHICYRHGCVWAARGNSCRAARPVINGYTMRVSTEQYDHTEVRGLNETLIRETFEHRYGYPATDVFWTHVPASTWEDPDTGEALEIPEQWHLTAEGAES